MDHNISGVGKITLNAAVRRYNPLHTGKYRRLGTLYSTMTGGVVHVTLSVIVNVTQAGEA